MVKHVFIGFGLALNGRFDEINTWKDEHHVFEFGGQGKRYHNNHLCPVDCGTDGTEVHIFRQRPVRPGMSVPHSLPWLAPDKAAKLSHDDMVAFAENDLDEDDQWIWEYCA